MIGGIEEIARLREWATTLAAAIRGSYGITVSWVNGYRDQVSQSLQVADATASTDGDRNAAQLLHHAFDWFSNGATSSLPQRNPWTLLSTRHLRTLCAKIDCRRSSLLANAF